jgi:hypothetical protein
MTALHRFANCVRMAAPVPTKRRNDMEPAILAGSPYRRRRLFDTMTVCKGKR